jgi:hypothetical protein
MTSPTSPRKLACRMNSPRSIYLSLLGAAVILVAGCGSDSEPPPVLSTEQITSSAPGVFDGAPAEVRQLASDAVEAINNQDYPTAWDKLQELNSLPDLTDEQKDFVAQSIASVGAQVQQAEESGDEAAQEVLKFHRANK